jgi:hypothetical protein
VGEKALIKATKDVQGGSHAGAMFGAVAAAAIFTLGGNFGTDGTFPSATPLFGEGELRLKPCEGSTASTSAFLWNQGSVRCIFDLWHEPFVPQRPPVCVPWRIPRSCASHSTSETYALHVGTVHR